MARRLTDDQRRIVETLDRPLFVAAGAGSGKSSTLAERVAWALDPASGPDGQPFIKSLDEVLVITFTRAAAEEIKEKIRERLREGGMDEHALAVDSAWISTIHGMCSRILRRHAFDLGLDPKFVVLEGSLQGQLVEQATDEVLREVSGKEEFAELLDAFPLRSAGGDDSASSVFGMVRVIRDAAGSALEGFDSVRFPGVAPDLDAVLTRLRDDSERALALGRDNKAFTSAKGMEEEERLEAVLDELEKLLMLPPERRAARALDFVDRLENPKDAYRKAAMKEVRADLRADHAEVALAARFANAGECAAEVVKIARMVDERYALLKAEIGALDNDDLLSLTFAAFRDHPDIAEVYGSKFSLVMVDEFQDTNAQQVKMIMLLSGEDACHLTTVGDAQQSIYRFRAADVQVFRDREYDSDKQGRVFLTMNFRSHADILSFVERSLKGEPLKDFMPLEPCLTRPSTLRATELPRVDVELVSSGVRDANSAARADAVAQLLADRIAERIKAGERPEDVALLLGRMSNLDVYLQALRSRGVDCVVSGGSTFSNAAEVRLVASLLHVLANPKDTQAGLFPVLSSELFSLEADDLCLLATKVQEANGAFARRGIDVGLLGFELPGGASASPRLLLAHEVLTRALSRLDSWNIEDILRSVLVESGWVARLVDAGAEGQARLANALAAVRHVGELVREGGLGPARAAVEFDAWLDASKLGPASLSGGDGGSVQVMTVHASKGLEFPLVAVAECWGGMSSRPIVGITCENNKGMVEATLVPRNTTATQLSEAVKEVDTSIKESADLIEWARYLTYISAERDQQERSRLLYVALTRARESLIVGMALTQSAKGGFSPTLASQVVGTLFDGDLPPLGNSMLDYGGTQPARVRHVRLGKGSDGNPTVAPEELEPVVLALPGFELAGSFSLYDAHEHLQPMQLLAEATSVHGRSDVFSYSSAHAQLAAQLQEAAGEKDEPALQAESQVDELLLVLDNEDVDAPDLEVDRDKATNLGSAFHELAQTMVETRADHSEERLEALARQWHLSKNQRPRLEKAIALWERSAIRQEALGHELVRAEVPFFIEVESRFGNYVEGAIDLLCSNPGSQEVLVVDYKTGDLGLTVEEVRERHEMQANFYAWVMMSQGFEQVTCVFVCVEREESDGEPLSVRYVFDKNNPPKME